MTNLAEDKKFSLFSIKSVSKSEDSSKKVLDQTSFISKPLTLDTSQKNYSKIQRNDFRFQREILLDLNEIYHDFQFSNQLGSLSRYARQEMPQQSQIKVAQLLAEKKRGRSHPNQKFSEHHPVLFKDLEKCIKTTYQQTLVECFKRQNQKKIHFLLQEKSIVKIVDQIKHLKHRFQNQIVFKKQKTTNQNSFFVIDLVDKKKQEVCIIKSQRNQNFTQTQVRILNQTKQPYYSKTMFYFINQKSMLRISQKGIGNLQEILNHKHLGQIDEYLKEVRVLMKKIAKDQTLVNKELQLSSKDFEFFNYGGSKLQCQLSKQSIERNVLGYQDTLLDPQSIKINFSKFQKDDAQSLCYLYDIIYKIMNQPLNSKNLALATNQQRALSEQSEDKQCFNCVFADQPVNFTH